MSAALPHIRGPEDFAAAFAVSRETIARLQTYAALLRHWQKAVNLVAPGTLDDIWHRHFADSAQLAAFAGDARIWLDLGSGAGFPGLVIAILLANRGDTGVQLVESNARKCAFLSEVARETGTSVEIHQTRIESPDCTDRVKRPDVITARALSPMPKLLAQAEPWFDSGARGLFLKGQAAQEELHEARALFEFEAILHPSRTDAAGKIVDLTNLRRKD